MLETNPALGWRDVQEILVRTARTHRPSDPGWFTNAAGWDFHPDFGAGLVDAEAAVALAASWSPLDHLKAADVGVVDLVAIPDDTPAGLTIPLVLTSTQLRAERVTVDVRLLHSRRGQLQLELTSPSGTTSVLKPVMSGDTQADFSPWLFSSVHFWGEAADGVWTLRCIDTEPEMTGVLVRADLRVFGTSPQKDDYEFWLEEEFTAPVVSDPAQFGVWGPTADPDGDGWSNVAEAYFGMRPEIPDAPAVWQVAVTERQIALRWRPGSLDEVEATPQWSPDLVHWYQGDEAPDGVERGFERFSDGADEVAVLPTLGLGQAYIRLSIARLPSQL
jgi:subtilisin-like proprotein convertase family protein